jgi:hypothetical protein
MPLYSVSFFVHPVDSAQRPEKNPEIENPEIENPLSQTP